MGKQKGAQDKGPNLGSIPNKDLIHRMNFLYQVASHLSQHSETVVPEGDNNKTGGKRRKRKGTLKDLAAFHVRTMKAIGTKSMVRMCALLAELKPLLLKLWTGTHRLRDLYARPAPL